MTREIQPLKLQSCHFTASGIRAEANKAAECVILVYYCRAFQSLSSANSESSALRLHEPNSFPRVRFSLLLLLARRAADTRARSLQPRRSQTYWFTLKFSFTPGFSQVGGPAKRLQPFQRLPTQTVGNGYGVRERLGITWLKPGVNEKASHLKLNQ